MTVVPTLLRMPGREGFSEAQNAALRESARTFREDRKWSQDEMGDQLGIGQQAYSRIERKKGGMSYATATRIALLVGFDGVDHFFLEHGVAELNPRNTPAEKDPYANRAHAVRLARQLGADEEAITAARRAEGNGLEGFTTRTWVDMIMRQSDELARLRQKGAPAREARERGKRRAKKSAA